MLEKNKISKVPLEERIKNGEISIRELKLRSIDWSDHFGKTTPVKVGNRYYCPVCLSELPSHAKLVKTAGGLIVCDFCVNYIDTD